MQHILSTNDRLGINFKRHCHVMKHGNGDLSWNHSRERKKHTHPIVWPKCFKNLIQACYKMQQIYNSSDMWYLWFAENIDKLKNEKLVGSQNNQDAECLGLDGFIKYVLPHTHCSSINKQCIWTILKARTGKKYPPGEMLQSFFPQGYYHPACPSQFWFQVFTTVS